MKRMASGNYVKRWKVLKRDNFTCQYCGQKAPGVMLVVDHIMPVSAGGHSVLENLVTACVACNIGKSNEWEFENGARTIRRVVKNAKIDTLQYLREHGRGTTSQIAMAIGKGRSSVSRVLTKTPEIICEGHFGKEVYYTLADG